MNSRANCTVVAALFGAVVVVPSGLEAQRNCKFRDDIELREPAGSELRVEAGAGRLVVTGRDGLDEIRVSATLCASDEGRLEDLGVTLRGDRLHTEYPSNRNGIFSWGRNRYARIDLVVEVPMGTNLGVDDGSGSIEITGAGDVNLEDGSGNMVIRDVGSLMIDDGSGSLTIRGVNGDLEIEDSSGNLDIREVSGDLKVGDGSGSVTIREVAGSVTISDGSGSIRVETVGGSVRMSRIGSGSVTVSDVEGDLVVADGRRKRIKYDNVRGVVDLPKAK